MANRAAFLESEKGKFVVKDTDRWEPGHGEVLVKVHAAAVQPADSKVAKFAIMKMDYPCILGSPVAGVVEALGAGVSKVSVGDSIVCGTKVLVHKKPMYGGLQRFCVVDESEVVEIGDTDYSKAVTLGSYTPPGALFGSLNMHRPSIPSVPLPTSEAGKKILIWGGSSAMGSLSISYAKQAGYTVISTSSPHNFDLLHKLGADHVFDHSDPGTVDKIRDLFPIEYWFDTISLAPSVNTIIKILAPEGKPVTKAHILLLLPLVMAGSPQLPEGITAAMHRFSTHSPDNADWNKWLLARGGYLETVIKNGLLQGVPAEVTGGLESAGQAIEDVNKGVSGKKLVVNPWA